MTMAENPPSTPSGTPPEDSRPRPRYGELAPEGWSWTPAPDERTLPAPAVAPEVVPAAGPGSPEKPAGPFRGGKTPAWDRPVTLSLLVFGLLATIFFIGALSGLPDAFKILYEQRDLGTYTPDDAIPGLIVAGSIAEALIWLATAVGSILMTVRGKRAFYLPLIGGVVSFTVLIVIVSVALTTDPTLLNLKP
ncbi:DUF6264 family protein [Cryobacterium sp. TMT1-21]|uniref:DUF6264 family protein n=2 Tax=unclassified Cryobacterium TaxID=2649013 RepID=UPI00351A0082